MPIIRIKMKKKIGRGGWRRLAYLAPFLPVILDFLLQYEGVHGIAGVNKCLISVLILPVAYAISSDKNTQKNRLPRYQRHLHVEPSNDGDGCYSHRINSDDVNCDMKRQETRGSKSRRQQTIQRIISGDRSFVKKVVRGDVGFFKILHRGPLRKFVVSKKEKKDCLRETTRLVGGANINVEAEKEPRQNESSNPASNISSDPIHRRKSFLENIIPKSKNFFVSKESEQAIRRNIDQGLTLMQKATSQVGPSFLTVLSLVSNFEQKDKVSFLTLYTLALLGASCGFHLFLHFITLGYALGVTLPLTIALLFYQVRVCHYRVLAFSLHAAKKNSLRV